MLERNSLQRGMVVRDGEGARLGTVHLLGDVDFEVRGVSSAGPHLLLRYQDIASLAGGEIHLVQGRETTREGQLGFRDREPVATVKPVASIEQLHVKDEPLDRWEGSAPTRPQQDAPHTDDDGSAPSHG